VRRTLLNGSEKYLDLEGNIMASRLELTVARLLNFLGLGYDYNFPVNLSDGSIANLDFKIGEKYLEVINSEADIQKFERVRRENPELALLGIGSSKMAAKISDLESINIIDSTTAHQVGSIFIEDPSLSFDYAHILPLVEKCSILHGHTSTVMVEIIGKMENNLVIDFSLAKRLIKETISILDHKFFINEKYVEKNDDKHYVITFEGPGGVFRLQVPKSTTYVLPGEATVENLSSIIINLLAEKMPSNVEALGVYVYEGVNKGAHMLANIR
jgi:6-pyruvoyltetrahydropterin/6-carboxytetrahydropterin synthase